MILWWTIISSSKLTLGEKLIFFVGYFDSISILSWAIIFLVTVNAGMLIYYIRQKGRLLKSGGATGVFGLIIGIIGGGCVSCGSVVLSVLGLTGAVIFLPFSGYELPWVSIGFLLISIYLLYKNIKKKNTC
ncbi:MAG: hypothetical protein AAB847_01485 [Patescibacteria group bacterium]